MLIWWQVVAVVWAAGIAPSVQQAVQTRTEQLLSAFKNVAVVTAPATLSAAQQQHNKIVFAQLDHFFDYETLTLSAVAAHRQRFKPAQLAQYQTLFRLLIRAVAFPRAGNLGQAAQIQLHPPQPAGEAVDLEVHALIPHEDMHTTMVFRWLNSKQGWRVIDVGFNGVWVVADYQNQFGRVLNKVGVEGLLEKLRQRLAGAQI